MLAAGGLEEVLRSSALTDTEGPQPTPPTEFLKVAESSSKIRSVLHKVSQPEKRLSTTSTEDFLTPNLRLKSEFFEFNNIQH